MQQLSIQQTADYLEGAQIEQTIEGNHAVVHFGTNAAGMPFVLINDCWGGCALTESL